MACALGRVQLSRIDEILALRRAAAERYHALLAESPASSSRLSHPGRTISWFVFVVRLPQTANRARMQTTLSRKGIASAAYFAPIHQQAAWRDSSFNPAPDFR